MIKSNKLQLNTILLLTVFFLTQVSLSACGGDSAPEASELPKATKTTDKNSKAQSGEDDEDDEDIEDDESADTSDNPADKTKTKEQIDQFLKYAKEIIDDELVLPQEIINSAKQYEKEFVEKKKWRGNYAIVTINKKGRVTRVKFRTKMPSVEYEDINDAFEAAVHKAQPFRNPPINQGDSSFDFKVRLLGTKSYVTQYSLKL